MDSDKNIPHLTLQLIKLFHQGMSDYRQNLKKDSVHIHCIFLIHRWNTKSISSFASFRYAKYEKKIIKAASLEKIHYLRYCQPFSTSFRLNTHFFSDPYSFSYNHWHWPWVIPYLPQENIVYPTKFWKVVCCKPWLKLCAPIMRRTLM